MFHPSNPGGGALHAGTNKKPRARRGPGRWLDASAAEDGACRDPVLSDEFGPGDLLAVLVLGLEHLDPPPLSGDEEALRADFGNFADLPLHRAEGAHQVLAAVEDLDLLAAERGPRAGGRVAAADEVVGEIDVVRPADLRFGGAAPAFVARQAFVLHCFLVLAGHDQVRGLE